MKRVHNSFGVVYMLIFQQIVIGETNRLQRICHKMSEVILKYPPKSVRETEKSQTRIQWCDKTLGK